MKCTSWRTPWLSGLLFGACLTFSEAALAQDSDDPPPPPKTGMETALADMEAGRFTEACPAIRQSYREDPRPSTLFHLAECYRKWGRIATAAVHYDDYLAAYDKLTDTEQKAERDHEDVASKQRDALEKQIPRVILRVPRGSPDSTRVLRKPLEEGPPIQVAIGVELLIDPGDHVLTTEVPGRASVFTKFSVKAGDKKFVDVEIPPASAKIEPAARAKPIVPVQSLTPPLDPGISGRRVAAYTLGGIGAVALLGGIVTGVITWGQKATIDKNCRGKICNPTGEAAKDTAAITGLISTITFPLGAVALGSGAVLYFTEPPPSKFGTDQRDKKVFVGAAVGPGSFEVNVQW